jgi:hypothetical protein
VAQQPGLTYIRLQFDPGEIGGPDDPSGKNSFRIGQINYEVIVSVSDCTRENLVWSRDVPGECCRQTRKMYLSTYIKNAFPRKKAQLDMRKPSNLRLRR